MKNSTNLSNRVFIFLSIVFVFLVTTESLRVAVAIPQLISSNTSLPSNDIQYIEAVHQADLQAKARAEKEASSPANKVTQASVGGWDFSGGRVIAIGAGAAVGIVALNYITGGTLATTTTAPVLAVATGTGIRAAAVTSAANSSMVSIYALVGAVIGGMAGNYLYGEIQSPQNLLSSP